MACRLTAEYKGSEGRLKASLADSGARSVTCIIRNGSREKAWSTEIGLVRLRLYSAKRSWQAESSCWIRDGARTVRDTVDENGEKKSRAVIETIRKEHVHLDRKPAVSENCMNGTSVRCRAPFAGKSTKTVFRFLSN